MSERTEPEFGKLIWDKEVVALQGHPLPVVYFDHAPGLSHMNGIIGITLTVTGHVPNETGDMDLIASIVAHLKCNIPAAISLRDALNKALLLAQPAAQGSQGQAN